MREEEMNKAINSAFECYRTSWCSIDENKVIEHYGESVLESIKRIYSYVWSYEVNWNVETMEDVLERLDKDIKTNYPFLNDISIRTLKNSYSYQWK